MASNIPAQLRTVDPYASYNSNVVNNLTGIVTRGSNVLDYYNSLQVISDSTSPLTQVTVLTGTVYKDDMLIEITAPHTVDFTDPDQYISPGISFSGEDGIYYLVLQYTYTKSRPAPQARIKILLPSQTSSFANASDLVFLKAVDALSGSIVALYDYDPNDTTVQREYIRTYASNDIILPSFDQERDQGRVTYVPTEDSFYIGYEDRWENIDAGTGFEYDTLGFSRGDLVYISPASTLAKALASLSSTTADGVITKVADKGIVQTVGRVDNVNIESGVSFSVGNLLYLSDTEPGKATTQRTSPFYQFLGRVKSITDSTSAEIIFSRGDPSGNIEVDLSEFQYTSMVGAWTLSGGSYYYDLDITAFDGTDVIIDLYDPSNSDRRFEPADIQYLNSSTARVWMPINTLDPEACIVGKAAATISSSDVKTVNATLNSGGSWILGGGVYHQDIDVSTLLNGKGVVTVYDQSTSEVIEPQWVSLTDATTVTVTMPVNTKTLEVTVVGEAISGITANITYSATLLSGGGWNSSGGLYYQDIDTTELGLDTEELVIGTQDADTGYKIVVGDIEFVSSTIIRIWMPVNTVSVVVIISG